MKTIFLYGFTGSKKDSETSRKFIDDIICFEYDSSLKQPLEEIAFELDKFIKHNTKKSEKINLIGVSAGGIIANYYTKFINLSKVNKIATICSPFGGTYVSYFYLNRRKGIADLLYGSKFLKKLNSKKLPKNKVINFYSHLDFVVPGNSGKGDNPVHTWDFLHFRIQKDKRIFKKIKAFFEE